MSKNLLVPLFLVIFILHEISLVSSTQTDVDKVTGPDQYIYENLEANQIEDYEEDNSTPVSESFEVEARARRRCRRPCREGYACVNAKCVPPPTGGSGNGNGNGNPRPQPRPRPRTTSPAPDSAAPAPAPTCLGQGAKCEPGNDQCCPDQGLRCDSFPLNLAYCLPGTADGQG